MKWIAIGLAFALIVTLFLLYRARNAFLSMRNELQDKFDLTHKMYVHELKNNNDSSLALPALIKAAEQAARKDSLKRSKFVAHGFSSENFAPLLQEHWSHKDFRHMGDPIDYIVFAGADQIRNKEQHDLDEVILLDIKTGKSQLNTIQRRIRDAVVAGRVRFATFNTDTGTTRTWPEKQCTKDQEDKSSA